MPALPQWRDTGNPSVGPAATPLARSAAPLWDAIGQEVNQYQAELDKKNDERDRIWASQQKSALRAKEAEARSQRWANGDDLTGLPDRITKDFENNYGAIKKSAPSSRAAEYLDAEAPMIHGEFHAQGVEDSNRYLVTKNFEGIVDGVESARKSVFVDPGSFAKLYAEQKALIDSVAMPAELRNKTDELLYGMGYSALQGQIDHGDPYSVRKQIKSGQWNEFIDADHLASIANQADAEVKRREAEARARAAMAQADNYQQAQELMQSDILSRKMTGKGATVEEMRIIKAGLSPKAFARYDTEAKRADYIFAQTGALPMQSNQEIVLSVEKLKPTGEGGVEGFKERELAYLEAQRVGDAILTQRKTDPGQAVRDSSETVRNAWQIAAHDGTPESVRAAVKQSQLAQTAAGIPSATQKLLPQGVADAEAGALGNTNPGAAQAALKNMASKYGEYWPKIYTQISPKLSSAVKVAATLPDDAAATMLLDAARVPAEKLRTIAGVKPSEMSDLITQNGTFRLFKEAVGPYGVMNNTITDVYSASETLALAHMTSSSVDSYTATNKAVGSILGDKYSFGAVNGRTFVIPKSAERSLPVHQIEQKAMTILRKLNMSDVDFVSLGRGKDEDDRAKKALVDSIKHDAYWLSTTGFTGLQLQGARGAITKNGVPIQYTWREIQAIEADKFPDDRRPYTYNKIGK